MKKQDNIVKEGTIVESLPNSMFRVKFVENGVESIAVCHLSGRMRMNFIKVMAGDRVRVEFSRYDPARGRIMFRF